MVLCICVNMFLPDYLNHICCVKPWSAWQQPFALSQGIKCHIDCTCGFHMEPIWESHMYDIHIGAIWLCYWGNNFSAALLKHLH